MDQIDKLSKWLKDAVHGEVRPPRFSGEQKASTRGVSIHVGRAQGVSTPQRAAQVAPHGAPQKPVQKSGGGFNKAAGFNKGADFNKNAGSSKNAGANKNRKFNKNNRKNMNDNRRKVEGGGSGGGHKMAPADVTRIIPIGGLEEVGKNSMLVERGKDILVIDMGFEFPEDELFGVDYIVPDIQYLVERKRNIRAILITHGHLDHIGALPYVLPDLGFPTIYASKLTAGLIKNQLKKHKMEKGVDIKVIDPDRTYELGCFKVDFFRVNHSIPDALGLAINSPDGTMLHTGDFKFDFTPADGIEADIGKLTRIGQRGVDVMFSDSTNALKPGHTMSEQVVAESLEKAIKDANGRIIIACFASLIGRIQQIIDFAQRHDRKVFLSGRSIVDNVEIAKELGFLKFSKELVQDVRHVNDYPDNKVLVLTTGSQGEPMAALSRMATDSHAQIKIKSEDTVVTSSSPIIGNEKQIAFLVDGLARLGAKIVHNQIMDVHTSGHGQQEDLKMMLSLVKPKHFVPVHGNYYMRKAHAELAPQTGVDPKNIYLLDNGGIIEMKGGLVRESTDRIKVNFVVIDGLGRGDLNSHVLKERESMAQNGIVNILLKMQKGRLVGNPQVTAHGFVYQKEAESVLREVEVRAKESVQKLCKKSPKARAVDYENFVRSAVAGLILKKLDRRPLIAAVVVHV